LHCVLEALVWKRRICVGVWGTVVFAAGVELCFMTLGLGQGLDEV
jgi:hypothetical protein